jgi:hypothetical protein
VQVLAEAQAAQFAVHIAEPHVSAVASFQYPALQSVQVLAEAHVAQFAVHVVAAHDPRKKVSLQVAQTLAADAYKQFAKRLDVT